MSSEHEYERESDKLWHRIDEHSRRVGHLEQRTSQVETRIEEHARSVSDLSKAASDLHRDMNQIIGGMRSLRWIGIALGVAIVVIQLFEKISEIIP